MDHQHLSPAQPTSVITAGGQSVHGGPSSVLSIFHNPLSHHANPNSVVNVGGNPGNTPESSLLTLLVSCFRDYGRITFPVQIYTLGNSFISFVFRERSTRLSRHESVVSGSECRGQFGHSHDSAGCCSRGSRPGFDESTDS